MRKIDEICINSKTNYIMKKLLIKSSLLGALSLALLSCGKIEEKKKQITASIAEKAVEKITGSEIDTFEFENIDKNKVSFDFQIQDDEIQNFFTKDFTGLVTIVDNSVAISCTSETQGGVIVSFHNDGNAKLGRPISTQQDGIKCSLTVVPSLDYSEGIFGWVGDDMEAEIVSLNDDQVVVKLKGELAQSRNEEKLPIEGNLTIKHPIFQVLGGKKTDYAY